VTERDLIDRVEVFNDSKELAAKLNAISEMQENKSDAYWFKEIATHIAELFALATDLSRALEIALTEKSRSEQNTKADDDKFIDTLGLTHLTPQAG
jgi:hypothetical protein